MNEIFIYSLNGEEFKVPANKATAFTNAYPDAAFVRKEEIQPESENFQTGTPDVGVPMVPAEIQTPDTGFKPVDFSSGSQEDKYGFEEPFQGTFFGDVILDYFGDIGRAFESGAAAGMSVDEAFDIYKQGASISDDDLDAFIAADKRIQAKGTSDEMLEYQRLYKEAGGGILGFIIANAKTRGQVLPQIIVSSIATMATSLESGEVRTAAAAGAGTGALVGSVATPIGTVTGAVGGGVAGLVGAMETSLTLSELLKEEIGSGELTKENIRAVLQDPEKLRRIKNKSIGRGIAIGAVEGITLGLSRGLATSLTKTGMKAGGVSARVAGLEAVGGSTGEIAGRVAAGQEMDTSDILFEGVAELKGVVNVADIVNKSQYKLNGEVRKKKDIQEFLSTATSEEIAGANIDIQNDNNFKAVIDEKQKDIYLQSTIPAEVTDTNDRVTLFRLEKERIKYKGNDTKTAQNMLNDINAEIKEITDKYKRRGPKTAETKAQIAENERIQKASQDRTVAKTIEFAETQGEKIGLETVVAEDNKAFEAALEKDGIKLSKEDKASIDRIGGYIEGKKIYINKDAAGKTGQINVGGHELLHGIIESADIKDMGVLVEDFKKQLSQDQLGVLESQMEARGYTVDSDTYAKEYLTNFSDSIADGTIKFNENVFTKIGDAIVNLLKVFGYENINFKDGKGVYNFMKEYSQNIKEGKLSEAVIKQAGGDINVQGAMSVAAADRVNQIYKDNPPSIAAQKIAFDSEANYRGMAESYLNDFLQNPNLSDEQKAIIERNRPDIAAMMLYDRIPSQKKGSKLRNVIGLVEGFEEVKNQYGKDGVAGYINKFFRRRGLEAINYYLKDAGLKNIETEDGTLRKDIKNIASDVLNESGPRQGQNIRKKKEREDKPFERKITLTELANDILKDPDVVLKKITEAITKELKLTSKKTGIKKGFAKVVKVNKDGTEVTALDIFVQKQLRPIVVKALGKITSEKIPGSTKRRAVIPASYSTTIETKYNEIADAMSLSDIKKRYNKLFKVTEVAREKTAQGNPVFEIGKPIKAEFIKYFTDTNIAMTTLVERQKMLGEIMVEAIASKILKEYNTVENLTELASISNLNPALAAEKINNTVIEQQINEIAESLNTYRGEKMLQDTRLFSKAPVIVGRKNMADAKNLYNIAQQNGVISNEFKNYNASPELKDFVTTLFESNEIKGTNKGGLIYEKTLLNHIEKSSNIKVLKEGTAGYNPNAPDLQLIVDGIPLNIEAKLASNARFGTTTLNVDFSGKKPKVKVLNTKDKNNYKLFESLVEKFIPELKQIIDFVNEKEGKSFTKIPFGETLSKSTVAGMRQLPAYKKLIKEGKVESDISLAAESYNAKGMYYIQIGDKGLYHIGKDILNLGTPKLDVKLRNPLQLKISGAGSISFGSEAKIVKPSSLENSTIDLNKPKDVKKIENTIKQNNKDGIYSNFQKNSNKGLLSRAAKEIKGKRSLDVAFNDIIEEKTGVASNKVYSKEIARVQGKQNKRREFYIPPSAEDFVGLMYKLLSKGKLGDAQLAWIKKHILNPYAKAMDQIARERILLMQNFRELKKQISNVPSKIKKKLPSSLGLPKNFTYETAMRVYTWHKQGMEIPGLTKAEIKSLVNLVKADKEMVNFSNELIRINKGGYPAPQEFWTVGNMTMDMIDNINTSRRAEILSEWQANVDEIFSEKNLNKLEAQFGDSYVKALKNILGRMKTGRNRKSSDNKFANDFLEWANGSVGVVMFFNMRSAVLQTISMVNYINWNDNNILAAGKAFANQKQFWADFKQIWNSDFLTTRREGLRLNVSESEIADMADKGGVKGVINYLLKLGFTPTRIADSFAIASGGATFFRNRTNTYVKQGYTKAEAETQAFLDFQELTEESQQSSRPDRISAEQASIGGRLFLAWANTPMQYGRLMKRSVQDLAAGRGDRNTNLSKLIYYSSMQNFIFNFMQKGAFALAFAQEDEPEKEISKHAEVGEAMFDSVVRGSGFAGSIALMTKSLIKDVYRRSQKDGQPNYQDAAWKLFEAFPPIDAKLDRAKGVGYAFSYEMEEMKEEGLSLENPALMAGANALSFAFNLPLDRMLRKYDNIQAALDEETKIWQSVALLLGWSEWSLDMVEDETVPTRYNRSKRKTRVRKTQTRK